MWTSSKSIAPSKITILLKSLFIAQTKNTVKPCGHHPQSIASNEKQTQNTHTHKSNPVVVAGFIIVISDTAISVHSSVIRCTVNTHFPVVINSVFTPTLSASLVFPLYLVLVS